jgi:hypothetical protein
MHEYTISKPYPALTRHYARNICKCEISVKVLRKESVLRSWQSSSWPTNLSHFIERTGSLLRSKQTRQQALSYKVFRQPTPSSHLLSISKLNSCIFTTKAAKCLPVWPISISLSACNNSWTAERIFVASDTVKSHKTCHQFEFLQKLDNNNGNFTQRPTSVYVRISRKTFWTNNSGEKWNTFYAPHTLYLLTPWTRVLPEKLKRPKLPKKFPAFYGTRRFITVFTRARHLSLSWARLIQSMPSHPASRRSILILSSHLRLGLPSAYTLYPDD